MVFDEATTRHLHSGCALLLGTVSADGAPHAARGHGMRVLSSSPPRVRVLLPPDERLLDNLRATGVLAITTAEVPTLVSLQLKGRVGPIGPLDDDDRRAMAAYTAQFVDDIVVTDRHDRAVLEPWATVDCALACDVEVLEVFDQTPGPRAGTTKVAR